MADRCDTDLLAQVPLFSELTRAEPGAAIAQRSVGRPDLDQGSAVVVPPREAVAFRTRAQVLLHFLALGVEGGVELPAQRKVEERRGDGGVEHEHARENGGVPER